MTPKTDAKTTEAASTVKRSQAKPKQGRPAPAGPHARPDLVNHEATPGAGALPPATASGGEVDGGTG